MVSIGEGKKKKSQQKITLTLFQTTCPNRIAFCVGKQGVCSTEGGALAQVFEKSATEPKPKLFRCKNIVTIATFNVTTLNTVNQLPELTVSAAEYNIDIICIQEYRHCSTIVSHFRIVHLSILSVPTLCMKDPPTRNDTIHPELLLMVGMIRWNKVAWVLATQKQEELSVNN